ncbi:hypothetical protein ACLOJK_022287, partial [Asimina triloba]
PLRTRDFYRRRPLLSPLSLSPAISPSYMPIQAALIKSSSPSCHFLILPVTSTHAIFNPPQLIAISIAIKEPIK